jgi:cation diffusion facilitator family transporter
MAPSSSQLSADQPDHPSERSIPAPHSHSDDHERHDDHQHGHSHTDDHGHRHRTGLWDIVTSLFHFHGHGAQQRERAADPALATEEGIRTIWMALGALSLTTAIQFAIVWLSGSVALLADTVHNFGDALNSVPLLLAFYLARRTATRRYTYGFGKAEDIAGIFIVLSIGFSAAYIFWESFQKLLHPAPLQKLPWVAAAAIVGFLGNEAVAWLQLGAGRRIGSDAMIADGMHARTDGLTSLAVLIAVVGTWLGYPVVDPLVGLFIGVAILFITRDAAKTMWYRLMDAIDPELIDEVEEIAKKVSGVQSVHDVRVRWFGHQLLAELHIIVDEDLTTRESHMIADKVRGALAQEQRHLALVTVHVDPCGHSEGGPTAAHVSAS